MKTIYLFRHAKSSWENSQLADFERPLNKRGNRDAPRMGQWLAQMNIQPDFWISSSAQRAWSTAQLVAVEIGLSEGSILKSDRLYHARPNELLQVIHELKAEASVILFGHNPGLTEFATLLCDYDFVNIPTSGIVCIQFAKATQWSETEYHQGKMLFFEYPKKRQRS